MGIIKFQKVLTAYRCGECYREFLTKDEAKICAGSHIEHICEHLEVEYSIEEDEYSCLEIVKTCKDCMRKERANLSCDNQADLEKVWRIFSKV